MYGDSYGGINVQRIISEAENNICKALPDMINRNSTRITDAILNNLEQKYEIIYDELLQKYKDKIRMHLEQETVVEIKNTFKEAAKSIINDLLKNKGGNNLQMESPMGAPINVNTGIQGGKKSRHRKFRKKNKTLRKKTRYQYD